MAHAAAGGDHHGHQRGGNGGGAAGGSPGTSTKKRSSRCLNVKRAADDDADVTPLFSMHDDVTSTGSFVQWPRSCSDSRFVAAFHGSRTVRPITAFNPFVTKLLPRIKVLIVHGAFLLLNSAIISPIKCWPIFIIPSPLWSALNFQETYAILKIPQSSKFTNVFFTVALTPSVTSTTPLLGVGWIHLLFNWAYTVLPAPSRGESTLNSPAVKPVPNLPSHRAWQAWSALWCNCNRLRLCTTHLPTPEGWKAELAWSVGWCVQFYPKTVTW